MLQKMISLTQCGVVALLMTSLVGAAPYSKYGRTCKDIGCLSSEVCVMNEDPCTTYSSNQCGRYPSCKKITEAGQQTCASLICPSGQYCRTENGRPTCVNTVPGLGYDSAGVSTVNGQPSQTNVNHDSPSAVVPSNTNYPRDPYANANAPPAPIPNPGQNYPVNSGTNLGYPAYPSNTGSNGYPPNPSINSGSPPSGTNLGYPAYPTNNRMPVPGQTYPQTNYPAQNYPGYPQQNPGYPQQNPGYPHQNNYPQQYPGYQNYPTYQNRGHNNYNTNNGYRKRNGGSVATPTVYLVLISFMMITKYFS